MIKIKADARETVRWFDNVQKKQLPFACSRALNAVAKDVKTAEQTEVGLCCTESLYREFGVHPKVCA